MTERGQNDSLEIREGGALNRANKSTEDRGKNNEEVGVEITFIGHSGFYIETKQSIALIDPWLSKHGAFWGGWQQIPKNHHLLEKYITKINSSKKNGIKAAVILSHSHDDHYDRAFIGKLRDCEVWIPKFYDDRFREDVRKIADESISIREILDGIPCRELANIEIEFTIDDQGVEQDSAIRVTAKDYTLLDLNDCKAYDKIAERYQDLNINSVATQYTTASAHPVAYKYNEEDMHRICFEKTREKFLLIEDFCRKVGSKRVILCGGPVLYTEHTILHKDKYRIDAIFNKRTVSYLEECILGSDREFILPALECDITKKDARSLALRDIQDLLKKEMHSQPIREIKNKKSEQSETKEVKSKLEEQIKARIEVLKSLKKRTNCKIIYICRDEPKFGFISVNLSDYRIESSPTFENKNTFIEPVIIYNGKFNTYKKLTDGKSRWQDVHLTFEFELSRSPDVYNELCHLFMLSEPSSLRQTLLNKEYMQKGERVYRETNGQLLEYDRYCPHNGADLIDAPIEGNKLRCPRHAWLFDLQEGGNCDRSDVTINCKRVLKRA